MRVLYIAGVGRSGSTLLSQMLGCVDGFFAVGESHHFWRQAVVRSLEHDLCGCGRPYAGCLFWGPVAARLRERLATDRFEEILELKRRVDRVRYLPLMLARRRPAGYARRLDRYSRSLRELYAAIREVSGARIVVDDTKDLSSAFLASRLDGVELSIVHLVRDARGVAHSWNQARARADAGAVVEYMPTKRPLQTAGYWIYSSLLGELSSRCSRGHLRVRYEDLVREPSGTLARICTLMGEQAPDLSFVDGTEFRLDEPSHILYGNPGKLSLGTIRLRLDDRWCTEMSLWHRLQVTGLTLPLLAWFGYLGRTAGGALEDGP